MDLHQKAQEIYSRDFEFKNFFICEKKLEDREYEPYRTELRRIFCDSLLDHLTLGFYLYDDMSKFRKDEYVGLFIRQAKKLYKTEPYFIAVAYFFEQDYLNCLKALKRVLKEIFIDENRKMSVDDFIYYFAIPFKNGFKSFWKKLGEMIKNIDQDEVIYDLCKMLESLYSKNNFEDILEVLLGFLQKKSRYNLS